MSLDIRSLANEWEDLNTEIEDSEAQEEEPDEGDVERRDKLQELADELGYGDLNDVLEAGIDLIAEDEFEDHAREVAEDLLGVNTNDWPMTCIDWKRAAEEMQTDYTTIEWDGDTYWTRDN
jgi:hypothetical protein